MIALLHIKKSDYSIKVSNATVMLTLTRADYTALSLLRCFALSTSENAWSKQGQGSGVRSNLTPVRA